MTYFLIFVLFCFVVFLINEKRHMIYVIGVLESRIISLEQINRARAHASAEKHADEFAKSLVRYDD